MSHHVGHAVFICPLRAISSAMSIGVDKYQSSCHKKSRRLFYGIRLKARRVVGGWPLEKKISENVDKSLSLTWLGWGTKSVDLLGYHNIWYKKWFPRRVGHNFLNCDLLQRMSAFYGPSQGQESQPILMLNVYLATLAHWHVHSKFLTHSVVERDEDWKNTYEHYRFGLCIVARGVLKKERFFRVFAEWVVVAFGIQMKLGALFVKAQRPRDHVVLLTGFEWIHSPDSFFLLSALIDPALNGKWSQNDSIEYLAKTWWCLYTCM